VISRPDTGAQETRRGAQIGRHFIQLVLDIVGSPRRSGCLEVRFKVLHVLAYSLDILDGLGDTSRMLLHQRQVLQFLLDLSEFSQCLWGDSQGGSDVEIK
jgi:hypothetical protein